MCPYLTATARRRIIILWRYSVNCCSINLVTRAAAPAVCSLVARTIRKCQASKYHSYGDNFPFFLLLFAAHKVEEMDKVPSCSSAARKNYAPSMQALQLLFSWINKGVEPPIENQGSAHHCMIYSSLAALACAYYIKNGGSWTSFSKQQILDGCPMEFKKRESYRKFFEYLNSGLNITTEANYPSNLINDSLVKQKLDNSKVKAPVVRAEWKSVIGKEEMMEAVRINPLVAGMCIDENMRRYVEKDEVYYDHAPGKRNHAVLILGYGTCEEGDYWIVQSSWGRKWGKDGIGRIARGSNMCGIEGTAYYPVLVDTSEMSSDAQELLVCVGGSHPTEDAAPSASFSIKPSRTSKARKEPHRTAHHLSKARKATLWVSMISFHAYVDVTYESTSDAGKGITDLKTAFQNIFGENLVEDKVKFLQMFSTERQYISSVTLKGEKLPPTACNGNVASHPNGEAHPVEVIRLVAGDMLVGQLYSRLVPLILLLVDGSSPIDVTDSSMEIYLIIQKTGDQEEETQATLLGLAATYRLYRYPESSRLRLSQILILPPYQRMGYGKTLLEVLSNVAISEDVYDFTIEEPLDSLQHVRNCLDIPRLLACTSVQEALNSVIIQLKEANLSKRAAQNFQSLLPKPTTIEVRKALKINKKQFIQCWEILIYLALDPSEKKHLDNFKTFIADRVKASMLSKGAVGPTGKRVVDVPSEYDEEASFVMYKPQSGEGTTVEVEGDQADLEQQLEKLVEERIESIKAVAKKPRMLIKSFRYIFVTAQDQYRVSDSFDSGSTGCW